ncbi:MAG: alpha/beta hydrolase [Pleurocapsa minor GSE-CHR-MK-17-07R]|jgi:pimeloyl-ACP methyl ester carboxylesterase|nr:alpha/beta hydrolase [Pleurocapsa minor GSE-CHR-MK 17-07R]
MTRKLLLVIFALLLMAGAASAQESTTVVLVHGAFQDESGWAPVASALEAQGYTVVTVAQPGRGLDDGTPLGEITLESYRDNVIAAVEAQGQPVILVGHSFGGMVISAVAEAIPAQIQALVYLAAYLPADGDSLVTLSSQDRYSVLGQEGNFLLAEDFSTAGVNPDIFASAFCPDCNEEQLAIVAASQLSEPLAPLNTPVALTAENFGSVRQVYILTAQDVVVSPQLQALMLANSPVDHVFALNAGHAAYVTAADALAALIASPDVLQ